VRSGHRKVVAAKVVTAERRRLLVGIRDAAVGVRMRPDHRVSGRRESMAERRVRTACTQARWIETIWGCGAWRMTAAAFMARFADDAARARAWQTGWRPVGDALTDAGRQALDGGAGDGAAGGDQQDVESGGDGA